MSFLWKTPSIKGSYPEGFAAGLNSGVALCGRSCWWAHPTNRLAIALSRLTLIGPVALRKDLLVNSPLCVYRIPPLPPKVSQDQVVLC